MVYTVTFNPAVDYIVHTKQLIAGATNRSDSEEIYFGGKGINVSIVLSELGVKSKALGFVAGFTGEAIENGVAEKGIDADFVHLNEGFSRINVKIKSSEETELNGQGPKITDEAIRELYAKLDEIQDGDTLVLAGSIPSSLPADIYERILERLSGKKIRAVVDATKDLLLNVLKYRPFLIKPNNFELGEIFGVEMKSTEDIVKYAGKLKEMGAQNVLVSMAGDGAPRRERKDPRLRRVQGQGQELRRRGGFDGRGICCGLRKGRLRIRPEARNRFRRRNSVLRGSC